jgi:2-methylisocitrate lyase-like PEP mutase family enzyme
MTKLGAGCGNNGPSESTMVEMAQSAEVFRRLHDGPELLILANAWDAASARIGESLGARAIATTSAGLAWAQGYPDGDKLPVQQLIAAIEGIRRAINVPLTVDVEGGYADDPTEVRRVLAAVIDAGAVGINIEDGAGAPDLLCAKIQRAKESGNRSGVALFVNARTDVYLRKLVPEAGRVAETLARAELYRAAGADGLFVPGVTDPAEIRTIAADARLPVNVIAWPGLPPAAELVRLGVRRLSAGSAIAESAMRLTTNLMQSFLGEGRSEVVSEGAGLYAKMNALLADTER